ncbi:BcCHSVII, class VII chitin synthase, partial [Rhizodiscina lignyota]
YMVIATPLLLMALVEWALQLVAFAYCFAKVFVKAENRSTKVLSVIMGIKFSAFKFFFLAIMAVTLPLPPSIKQHFPERITYVLQWAAFYSFMGLLFIPWLVCVYQLVINNVGRQNRIQKVLDENSAPKLVIVMPCYKEEPPILMRTVESIADCAYPPSCMHIFLSFDGDQIDLFKKTVDKLGLTSKLEEWPKSVDLVYRGIRVTVSRFEHGGKRHCQKKSFQLIDRVYAEYLKRNDNLFVLFIDSDCIMDRFCIQNFLYEMELKPGSKGNMLAMTGVITSTTDKTTLITLLQDMEYIHGQLFERTVESACGAVTCLPGALTLLRFSAFRKMAKYYFADKAGQMEDHFDYGKCHLGEDRWLTHLFMIGATKQYQIQMNTGAFCKTEAVQTYKNLTKQRRRWFLGYITNECCMLTDYRLWKRYPVLCLLRFAQNNIRTTSLLFTVMLISISTTSQKIANMPVGFLALSYGLNQLLMIYFAILLKRFKLMAYILMFVFNPFFNWWYTVNSIWTYNQRTWGGPRADAAKADAETTPEEAIAEAEENGDELNVVPESFRPAIESRLGYALPPTHLLPPDNLEGRFAAGNELPLYSYEEVNRSTMSLPDLRPRNTSSSAIPLHPTISLESLQSRGSALNSIYLPRRVESFVGVDDAMIYHLNQAAQPPAGGAFYESPR